MARRVVGLYASHVSHAAAAVLFGVAVEDFVPGTGARHAETVVLSGHRGKVGRDEDDVVCRRGSTQKSHDAVGVVVDLDPPEPFRVAVALMERRFVAVQMVQALDAALGAIDEAGGIGALENNADRLAAATRAAAGALGLELLSKVTPPLCS